MHKVYRDALEGQPHFQKVEDEAAVKSELKRFTFKTVRKQPFGLSHTPKTDKTIRFQDTGPHAVLKMTMRNGDSSPASPRAVSISKKQVKVELGSPFSYRLYPTGNMIDVYWSSLRADGADSEFIWHAIFIYNVENYETNWRNESYSSSNSVVVSGPGDLIHVGRKPFSSMNAVIKSVLDRNK